MRAPIASRRQRSKAHGSSHPMGQARPNRLRRNTGIILLRAPGTKMNGSRWLPEQVIGFSLTGRPDSLLGRSARNLGLGAEPARRGRRQICPPPFGVPTPAQEKRRSKTNGERVRHHPARLDQPWPNDLPDSSTAEGMAGKAGEDESAVARTPHTAGSLPLA